MKDFTKTEEMYRQALDCFEMSLGYDHELTRDCAMNNAALFCDREMNDKEKMRSLVVRCPHLVQGDDSRAAYVRAFIT